MNEIHIQLKNKPGKREETYDDKALKSLKSVLGKLKPTDGKSNAN